MSLSRLWQQQGKCDAARTLLAPIYSWFTEGFDTADIQEAKALLEALSRTCKVRGRTTAQVNRLIGHFGASEANFSAPNYLGAAVDVTRRQRTRPSLQGLACVPINY